MFLTEFLKEIEQNFAFLKDYGFAWRTVDPSHTRFVWFEKHSATEGFRVMFHWTQYGEKYYIKEVRGEKRFNEVESEITRVISGSTSDLYTIHITPDLESFPKRLNAKQTTAGLELTILSKDDLIAFALFVRNFYLEHISAFFETYANLSTVNAQLNALLEKKQIQTLLTSAGNTTMLRCYLIAVNFDNQAVLNFFSQIYFPYLESNSNKSTAKMDSERFKLLKHNIGHS